MGTHPEAGPKRGARARPVDALVRSARQALTDVTEETKWDIVRDLVEEIKVSLDKTLEIVGHIGQPESVPTDAGKSRRIGNINGG